MTCSEAVVRGATAEFLCSFHEPASVRRGPIGDRAVQHIRPRRLACICLFNTTRPTGQSMGQSPTESLQRARATRRTETGKGQGPAHSVRCHHVKKKSPWRTRKVHGGREFLKCFEFRHKLGNQKGTRYGTSVISSSFPVIEAPGCRLVEAWTLFSGCDVPKSTHVLLPGPRAAMLAPPPPSGPIRVPTPITVLNTAL